MKIHFYFTLILLIISAPLKAQRIYESSARKIGIEQIDKFKSFLALPNNAAKTEQIDANINWAEQELGSLGFDLKRLKTSHLLYCAATSTDIEFDYNSSPCMLFM